MALGCRGLGIHCVFHVVRISHMWISCVWVGCVWISCVWIYSVRVGCVWISCVRIHGMWIGRMWILAFGGNAVGMRVRRMRVRLDGNGLTECIGEVVGSDQPQFLAGPSCKDDITL